MAKSNLQQCIKTDIQLKEASKVHPEVLNPVLVLNSNEGFRGQTFRMSWWPIAKPFMMLKETHYHDFDQYLMFVGGDASNALDLGGEVELMLGEKDGKMEKFVFTQAAMVHIPAGVRHGPLTFKKVNDPAKPIMFHDFFMEREYIRNVVTPQK